jgi:hypothetical protein
VRITGKMDNSDGYRSRVGRSKLSIILIKTKIILGIVYTFYVDTLDDFDGKECAWNRENILGIRVDMS